MHRVNVTLTRRLVVGIAAPAHGTDQTMVGEDVTDEWRIIARR
jgi:hypothetical protein